MPRALKLRSWWKMNGLSATSKRDFGIRSVSGCKRVANPPARIATGNLVRCIIQQNGVEARMG
jgi:hypothetical protein